MKILGAILILVLTVISSVMLTLYILDWYIFDQLDSTQRFLEQRMLPPKDRFELIFAEVLHEVQTPSKEESGLINIRTEKRPVCLKFDRLTGKVWQHVDSFYYDPNIITRAHGFVELTEGYQMYETTSRKPFDPNTPRKTISTEELFNVEERTELQNRFKGLLEQEQKVRASTVDTIPQTELILVKCANKTCNAAYQTGKKAYFKYLQEHANPLSPTAPPLVCEKCGEQSVYRAYKCQNPDCGAVFFSNSVPNDYADRCPECGRSETEEKRKRSLDPK